MKLRLDACAQPLAEIDLGAPSESTHLGYFDDGDLSATGGNLYLYLDGVEYGSLFFIRREDGTVVISLGQFDFETQEWVEKSSLDTPVKEGS